ncbi:hypothetical protein F5880DRAFT_87243 [Lentinula raphanica]|nr:hypothetical protein F5880DRAFT_87243 [Lentinula raphanica]
MAAIVPPLSNIDRDSALLIAQLALGDINALQTGSTIPDQDLALQLMAQDFAEAILYLNRSHETRDVDDRTTTPDVVTLPSTRSSLDAFQVEEEEEAINTASDSSSSVHSWSIRISSRTRDIDDRTSSSNIHSDMTLPSTRSSLDASQVEEEAIKIASGARAPCLSNRSIPSQISLINGSPQMSPIMHLSPTASELELEYGSQISNLDLEHSFLEAIPTCVVCMGSYNDDPIHRVSTCEHHYCDSCLSQYIETCIHDESLFPPKCCGRTLSFVMEDQRSSPSIENLAAFIEQQLFDNDLGARLRAKASELGMSPEDRLYCPYPRCSVFLGSWATISSQSPSGSSKLPSYQCSSCSQSLCLLCRGRAHYHLTYCPVVEDQLAEDKVRDLARQNKWQTCPKCKAIVELTQGCNHMVCRCRTEFCYTCGSLWTEICVCRG